MKINLSEFGLSHSPSKTMPKGTRFGNLVVLATGKIDKGHWTNRVYYAVCRCDCGNTSKHRRQNLISGYSKSCGCLKEKNNIHGGPGRHPLAKIWAAIMRRCYEKGSPFYRNYGGRGISVCAQWHNRKTFINDMLPVWEKGLTLDRINNNGHYEPSNVRFTTRKEQANNRRGNVLLTHNGETKTATQWAEQLGFNPSTLRERYRKGWSDEAISTTPVR